MHPVVYNKLQLSNIKEERIERDCLRTESEGAHATDSDKLFHSEITLVQRNRNKSTGWTM